MTTSCLSAHMMEERCSHLELDFDIYLSGVIIVVSYLTGFRIFGTWHLKKRLRYITPQVMGAHPLRRSCGDLAC